MKQIDIVKPPSFFFLARLYIDQVPLEKPVVSPFPFSLFSPDDFGLTRLDEQLKAATPILYQVDFSTST